METTPLMPSAAYVQDPVLPAFILIVAALQTRFTQSPCASPLRAKLRASRKSEETEEGEGRVYTIISIS